ncbi:MAG: glycoside hydrolase family 16 protein, partial [Armatimonadota bacterium]|nr:glycoside hydrolase family 16 protein [Armatimonadota bacterium]
TLLCGNALAEGMPPEEIKPFLTTEKLDGYKLAWHDEFDSDKLNAEEWNYRTGVRFWSTQKPENVSIENGLLRLILKKEKSGQSEYTAGGVISKRQFKYGYYEARFKCPPRKGWHTSFWMMPYAMRGVPRLAGASQEIDVCETDSVDVRSYTTNVHQWKPQHKGLGAKKVKTPDLSADFHIWGCEFTPQTIRFFFDGALAGTKDVSSLTHDSQSIWLTSIASPLGKTDAVDETQLPAYADFDWVRFYEKTGTP